METMETATRKDDGKPDYSLLDFIALDKLAAIYAGKWQSVNWLAIEELTAVMQFGCNKYARDNWKKGMKVTRCIASLRRHWVQLLKGEHVDKESGCSHYGHILANAMFISRFMEDAVLNDRQTLIDPEIVVGHLPPKTESEALQYIDACLSAFSEGQDEDQNGEPLIGLVMHYACIGFAISIQD